MYLYKSEPCSREYIRSMTRHLRKIFKTEDRLYFPVMGLLESLHELSKSFYIDVVADKDLPINMEANTDVLNHVITMRQSVYDGAFGGNGRDRFTISHEIGHYLLPHVFGVRLQRNLPDARLRKYEDPEWQADVFAGELLMPWHLVQGMDAVEIMEKCGVSWDAANVQVQIMRRAG